MKNILYHGRFQPSHRGHIRLIKHFLNKYKNSKVIIVVDVRDKDIHNPFSFEYRKNKFLKKLKGYDIEIVPHYPKEFTINGCLSNIWNEVKDKNINLVINGPNLNQEVKEFWNNKNILVETVKKRFYNLNATEIRRRYFNVYCQ